MVLDGLDAGASLADDIRQESTQQRELYCKAYTNRLAETVLGMHGDTPFNEVVRGQQGGVSLGDELVQGGDGLLHACLRAADCDGHGG